MFRIAPGLRARGNSTTKPTKMKGGRRGSSAAHEAMKGTKTRDRTCVIKVLSIFLFSS